MKIQLGNASIKHRNHEDTWVLLDKGTLHVPSEIELQQIFTVIVKPYHVWGANTGAARPQELL